MRISDWCLDVCSSDLSWLCSRSCGRKRADLESARLVVRMNLKLALFDDASGSGNSTHRFVATGHGILSLSVNMSPMSRATSHGAQRPGKIGRESCRGRVCQLG